MVNLPLLLTIELIVAIVPEFSPRMTSPTITSYLPSILINSSGRLSITIRPVLMKTLLTLTANFSPVLNSEVFVLL